MHIFFFINRGISFSGAMNLLDCVGIEFIVEGMRQTIFEILSNNSLENSHTCNDKEIVPAKLKVKILDESRVSNPQDGISVERMLVASFGSSVYRYYILKMRDFYCLPAFLATVVPYTPGYLKLEIENQTPHYYVFADQIEFQDVLAGSVYEFNIPKSLKAVTLNVMTKEINAFLTPDMLPQELFDQCDEGSLKVFPFGNQSYSISSKPILKSLLQETSTVNAKLFSCLRLFSPLIINNDSFIFSFLNRFPRKVSSVPSESPLITKFNNENPFASHTTNYFLSHIKTQYEICKNRKLEKYFSAIMTIERSTGYEKGPSLVKYGKYLPLFYASLHSGSGFPGKSEIMCMFIKYLDDLINSSAETCFLNTASTILYTFLLRIMYVSLFVNDSSELNPFILDDRLVSALPLNLIKGQPGDSYKEKFFSILVNRLDEFFSPQRDVSFDGKNTIPLPSELQTFGPIPTVNGPLYTENLEKAVFDMLEKSKRGDLPHSEFPSIFVIDEAQYLIHGEKTTSSQQWNFKDSKIGGTRENLTECRTVFHILRRMCRIFKGIWENIIFIVISTSGRDSNSLAYVAISLLTSVPKLY